MASRQAESFAVCAATGVATSMGTRTKNAVRVRTHREWLMVDPPWSRCESPAYEAPCFSAAEPTARLSFRPAPPGPPPRNRGALANQPPCARGLGPEGPIKSNTPPSLSPQDLARHDCSSLTGENRTSAPRESG